MGFLGKMDAASRLSIFKLGFWEDYELVSGSSVKYNLLWFSYPVESVFVTGLVILISPCDFVGHNYSLF